VVTGARAEERASQNAPHPRTWRRSDGDAHRPSRAQHLRPFAIVKQIVDAKAQFRSLAEPWADTGTSTSTGRLMIAVLGGLADVERDLIRTRTAEGRSRAQRRGQHMGRPPKLRPAQKAEARRRLAQGATLAELARSYDVEERARFHDLRCEGVMTLPYDLGTAFISYSHDDPDLAKPVCFGCK
jgi:hypothetical protein